MQSIIHTVHLFPVIEEKLVELLRSLTPEEWNRPTVAKLWTVKDVAAHLLDTSLRTLSTARDGFFGDPPGVIDGYDSLVGYLNKLNADWVNAYKRVSPAVLTELIDHTRAPFCAYIASLDPFDTALFSVGWAGEDKSYNWFHIAREYTERWHHQQQIREAVGKPGIMTDALYYPMLDTFMRALPFTYRNTNAAPDTVLRFTITGPGGGDWWLIKKEQWALQADGHNATGITTFPAPLSSHADESDCTAHTTIDGAVAWKLFSKSWRRADVLPYVTITGDEQLGAVVLDMISVMA